MSPCLVVEGRHDQVHYFEVPPRLRHLLDAPKHRLELRLADAPVKILRKALQVYLDGVERVYHLFERLFPHEPAGDDHGPQPLLLALIRDVNKVFGEDGRFVVGERDDGGFVRRR